MTLFVFWDAHLDHALNALALASGLPKLVHVSLPNPPYRLGKSLKAFAIALSEQRHGSSGGGCLPCLQVEVYDDVYDGSRTAVPLWPLSRQREEHPGVEVWDRRRRYSR
jgi:hypothetical protein